MYGPNQVGELIIGDSAGAAVDVKTFATSAAVGAIQIFGQDGLDAPAANTPWKALQKTSASAPLNYEFSDIIDPIYTESVIGTLYAAEVQKAVLANYTGHTPLANTTYGISIYLYNDGGSLSPENFTQIQGYYVTGAVAPTLANLLTGLGASLQENLDRRGGGEFALTITGTGITVTSIYQNVVPGKIIGTPLAFDVRAVGYENVYNLTQPAQNLNPAVITISAAGSPGNGTGKYAVNFEWFIKGQKYEVYRQTGYPADFNTPYYADKNGTYNVIKVKYYKPRKETSVERQYKILTILVKETGGDSSIAYIIMDAIKTATGTNGVIVDPFTV